MATPEFKDLVRDLTVTTGTGTITLTGSTLPGMRTLNAAHTTDATVHYRIANDTLTEWEVGEGVYTAATNTLTRATVYESSNGGALVNFSAGNKTVITTVLAEDIANALGVANLATRINAATNKATPADADKLGALDSGNGFALVTITIATLKGIMSAFSGRNALINGTGEINQLVVSGTVILSAGQYGHDGFKAGSGGCTYTFSVSQGVTTFHISAGTLVQVASGKRLRTSPYILGYDGTAPCRIDGGAWGASGMSSSATRGTNQTIEWGVGTLSLPQYEPGSVRTAFEFREDELERCRLYFRKSYDQGTALGAATYNGSVSFRSSSTSVEVYVPLGSPMSGVPVVTLHSATGGAITGGYMRDVIGAVDVAASASRIGDAGFFAGKDTAGSDGYQYAFHWSAENRL